MRREGGPAHFFKNTARGVAHADVEVVCTELMRENSVTGEASKLSRSSGEDSRVVKWQKAMPKHRPDFLAKEIMAGSRYAVELYRVLSFTGHVSPALRR